MDFNCSASTPLGELSLSLSGADRSPVFRCQATRRLLSFPRFRPRRQTAGRNPNAALLALLSAFEIVEMAAQWPSPSTVDRVDPCHNHFLWDEVSLAIQCSRTPPAHYLKGLIATALKAVPYDAIEARVGSCFPCCLDYWPMVQVPFDPQHRDAIRHSDTTPQKGVLCLIKRYAKPSRNRSKYTRMRPM